MNTKQYYDQRGRIVAQMKDLGDRLLKEDFTFDEEVEKQFKGFNDELEAVDKKIKALERLDEIQGIENDSSDQLKEVIKPTETVEEVQEKAKRAFLKYVFKGENSLNAEDKKHMRLSPDSELDSAIHIYHGQRGVYDGRGAGNQKELMGQIRAQGTGSTAGGDFIAQDFAKEVEQRLLWYGPFANKQITRVWNSDNGANMPYPTVDDTANTGALLSEAGDASSSVTDVTTGAITFAAYKYTSKLIKLNRELAEDSYFDVIGFISDALATRLGRALNTAFTTGTGSSQPQGAVIGGSQGVLSASATAFTASEILNFLMTSLDVSYMNRPLTRVMMHQNLLYQIRLLDTSTSNYTQPIWQPSFAAGVPDTVAGVPYALNNDMDSALATGNKVLLYGDFSKFITRWILPMRMVRLDERFAETDQVGVVAFQRVDSHVIQSAALQYFEMT